MNCSISICRSFVVVAVHSICKRTNLSLPIQSHKMYFSAIHYSRDVVFVMETAIAPNTQLIHAFQFLQRRVECARKERRMNRYRNEKKKGNDSA